jgi:hypothetical protein
MATGGHWATCGRSRAVWDGRHQKTLRRQRTLTGEEETVALGGFATNTSERRLGRRRAAGKRGSGERRSAQAKTTARRGAAYQRGVGGFRPGCRLFWQRRGGALQTEERGFGPEVGVGVLYAAQQRLCDAAPLDKWGTRRQATGTPTGGPHRRLFLQFQINLEIGFLRKKNSYEMRKNPRKFVEVENQIWNTFLLLQLILNLHGF